MGDNEVFEAGRKTGLLENLFRKAAERAIGYKIKAEDMGRGQNVCRSLQGAILGSPEYYTAEELRQEIASYRKRLVISYKEYRRLARQFPDLEYFKNGINTMRLKFRYVNASRCLREADMILKKEPLPGRLNSPTRGFSAIQ
jgi:hypothetical protein